MQVRMDERPGAALFHRVARCGQIGVTELAITRFERWSMHYERAALLSGVQWDVGHEPEEKIGKSAEE